MGNAGKISAGAIGIAAALGLLGFGAWITWHFVAGGPGSAPMAVQLSLAHPAPPSSWRKRLPLASVPNLGRKVNWPRPIVIGRADHIPKIPLVSVAGLRSRPRIPAPISTGLSGNALASNAIPLIAVPRAEAPAPVQTAIAAISPIPAPADGKPIIAPIDISHLDDKLPDPIAIAPPRSVPAIAAITIDPVHPPKISPIVLAPVSSPAVAAIDTHAFTASVPPTALAGLAENLHGQMDSLSFDTDILDPGQQLRRYVMALCTDHQGNLWVGCEDTGVWRHDAAAPADSGWTQFSTKDGLGDDNGYALACDRKGRIWAGHLNHGVSVFNGRKWQNCDVIGGLPPLTPPPGTPGAAQSGSGFQPLIPGGPAAATRSLSGPLGERIFHITVNPADGDVWICSSAGLARYSESHDTWTYYTRADGLPSDQANGIAFAPDGRIFVATQCDGVAIGTIDGSGNVAPTWRVVTSPYPNQPGPAAPTGPGLPCNLLNDILVTPDGTVYCATDAGLAWSTDEGITWQYLRGKDWADKIKQSAAGPPPGPPSWTATVPSGVTLLEKDYITCLAESADGQLLLGYRPAGRQFEIAWHGAPEMTTLRVNNTRSGESVSEILNATCIDDTHDLVAGTYAKELQVQIPPSPPVPEPMAGRGGGWSFPPLPSGAPTPTLADLNAELADMAKVPPLQGEDAPKVMPLDQDWTTDGRWLGRYGRWTAVLCSMLSPFDYVWGAGPEPMDYHAQMGPHNQDNDTLRYWIAALQTTAPADLEIPPIYMDSRVFYHYATPEQDRRPAFWDDHGETYPGTWEGPDIYCNVHIPAGTFILSIESQDGKAARDLDITFRQHRGEHLYDHDGDDMPPILATSRSVKFATPNYQRFLVNGPEDLTLKVARNYSFISSVWAIFLDAPDERPVPYFMSVDEWKASRQERAVQLAAETAAWQKDPAGHGAEFAPATTELAAAKMLLARFDEMRDWNPRWWALNHRRVSVLIAHWAAANVRGDASNDALALKGSADYEVHSYMQWEACRNALGQHTSRDIEKSMKWDHVVTRDSGHEFDILTKHLYVTGPTTQPAK